MIPEIKNGEYTTVNGKIKMIGGISEIIQTVKTAFYCKKGSFYPDKAYGLEISGDCCDDAAAAYTAAALLPLSGVNVVAASCAAGVLTADIIINSTEVRITV